MQRRRLRITGTVQGVGLRPCLHQLASRRGLTGATGNDVRGLWCEIQGTDAALDDFVEALRAEAPTLAEIEAIESVPAEVVADEAGFTISDSATEGSHVAASVPADAAPCATCRAEIEDPQDRRHGYAFTCCTDCGPRYTVIRALPYDRARTSLADFPLCESCAAEYADPADRRHHAQATCCPDCGPRLRLRSTDGRTSHEDPIPAAAELVRRGAILAIKGVGGYQLVCRADDEAAVSRLRTRKHRDEKPFALMVPSVATAASLVELDDAAVRALTGPEAPIILASRREAAAIAPSAAPHTQLLGLMLPATPLHVLLASAIGDTPLVCTSGNRSDEPIVIDDPRVADHLGHIADAVLQHDRRIERRADDSVGQVVCGDFQVLRRAHGFAPRPVRIGEPGATVLGVGAELKSTVCLASGLDAHLSAHLGDLERPAALAAFEVAVSDLLGLARATPEVVVHDLHPEYLSTKFAQAAELAPTLAVQHHHAHMAACLVDNRRSGPAIGVTFDGLGWGADGALWGGEFLVGDAAEFQRIAHLSPVPMPGGGVAIREPWRMALSYLAHAFSEDLPPLPLTRGRERAVAAVLAQCGAPQSLMTSSVGRLFDAVAALCGIVDTVSYEGQAAIRLEQAASVTSGRYPVEVHETEAVVVDTGSLVRAIVNDLRAGADIATVAGDFHHWVADMVAAVGGMIRERTDLATVVLSGGVFQNRRLVELTVPGLEQTGFEVLTHRQVPPNDGGISLGQVAIGRAMLARERYG